MPRGPQGTQASQLSYEPELDDMMFATTDLGVS